MLVLSANEAAIKELTNQLGKEKLYASFNKVSAAQGTVLTSKMSLFFYCKSSPEDGDA